MEPREVLRVESGISHLGRQTDYTCVPGTFQALA